MMRKRFSTMIMASAAALSLLLSACSGGGGTASRSNPSQVVQGVAASGSPIVGTVTLKDASLPSRVLTTTSAANGSFSFNTDGLTQPYVLSVSWTDNTGVNQLYSIADGPGTANINPFSNAVFAASAGSTDLAMLFNTPAPNMYQDMSSRHTTISDSLRSKLAPLFDQYGTSADPITDDYHANHRGLDAMFDDVKITVSNGMITVTNRETGAVIFTAPVNDIPSGTFDDGNMPGGTGKIDGVALYTSKCSTCHGPLATSNVSGATVTMIKNAIMQVSNMSTLSSLSALQIQAVATALSSTSTSTTTPPTACTYTYDVWGACQPSNMQTRNVLSSSPAGCTGTPVVSQACVYVPPTPSTCAYTYNAWGACQSNNTQIRTVATALPTGCTGTPVTSQTCTYTPPCTYTYDVWGTCQSNNTQTRNVLTTTPTVCTGTPITSQACTYVPPTPGACTYTYSGWGACQSNNTQTRTFTATPTGCTGTPVTSQACVYTPPSTLTLAQVTASCTQCHGLTANTTVLKAGGYSKVGASASQWLTTTNRMIGYDPAAIAAGTTAQDYANFLSALP